MHFQNICAYRPQKADKPLGFYLLSALAKSDPESALFLAALVAWKTNEANALLAVAPQGATVAAHVQVRLASVSLVTMAQLQDLQQNGRLSGHMANMAVWAQAGAA